MLKKNNCYSLSSEEDPSQKKGDGKKNGNREKRGAADDGNSTPRYFTLSSPLFVSARAQKRPGLCAGERQLHTIDEITTSWIIDCYRFMSIENN